MYQDWMENTPIFGKIKNVYVSDEATETEQKK